MPDAHDLSMAQQRSLTLFRVRGVPIRAHWTLLLIIPYLALVLSTEFRSVAELAGVANAQLMVPPLVWGALLALGLFASILLHELAHTFAAIRFGGRVKSITLMLLGGVSQLARSPRRSRDEAIMAAVGPATSLALGGLLYLGYASSGAWPADLQMGLFYLAATNVMLGVFNLLPAFPMDGGRLLRAVLAIKVGRERATNIAARIGRWCAILMGVLGLWSSNFMLMLIAVFVYAGASGEVMQERVRAALEGMRVVDLLPVLRRPLPMVASHQPLDRVVQRMRDLDRLELIVVDLQGMPLGVIQANDFELVPQGERSAVTVGELVSRLPVRQVSVPSDVSANDAIDRAAEAGAEFVLVVDPDVEPPNDLVGMVAAADISRMVTLMLLSKRPPGATTARPRPTKAEPA
ncbi:MAG: protease [Deltaproteobacteria bacterium]|nr:protease [Deltaproteobacteria bacterium]